MQGTSFPIGNRALIGQDSRSSLYLLFLVDNERMDIAQRPDRLNGLFLAHLEAERFFEFRNWWDFLRRT